MGHWKDNRSQPPRLQNCLSNHCQDLHLGTTALKTETAVNYQLQLRAAEQSSPAIGPLPCKPMVLRVWSHKPLSLS